MLKNILFWWGGGGGGGGGALKYNALSLEVSIILQWHKRKYKISSVTETLSWKEKHVIFI